MSTRMSSDPIITRESGRCQRKPFLNLWDWARENQLPITLYRTGQLGAGRFALSDHMDEYARLLQDVGQESEAAAMRARAVQIRNNKQGIKRTTDDVSALRLPNHSGED
jgi:hypothetical protein